MGNCCCPPEAERLSDHDGAAFRPAPSNGAPTPKDDEARRMAAARAEQRQQNFEVSPYGRAAYKGERDLKAPPKGAPSGGTNDNARDWLS